MIGLRTRSVHVAFALAALALAAVPARAATMTFHADLNGASQVPPVSGNAAGSAEVTYDTATKNLSWTVTYSGLTGDATAAHFHGPAKAGKNAAPVVPLSGALASPIKGTATLTADQEKDLVAELWYVKIHTAAFPGGEIRGQVLKAK